MSLNRVATYENRVFRRVLIPILDEVLGRAMVFARKESVLDESVTITIAKRKLKIRAESEEGWFEEDVNIQYDEESIKFNITPFLLKDILSETQDCIVGESRLKFEGEGWQYVIALRV